jgi:hypothetical protein
MSHTPDDAASNDGTPSRTQSLARIVAATARLRALHVHPPDAFAWSHHEEVRWWAVGDLGRSTVSTPERSGWAVGDYPWEGAVHHARETLSNEVFVKPTYVDVEGRVLPLDNVHPTTADPHLLTAEMLDQIATRMEEIVHEASRSQHGEGSPSKPHDGGHA